MKLHYSPASQYVRKVLVVASELGLEDRIELIADKKDLEKHNPLLKRPVLITDEGDAIIDSPVICGYLDSLAGGRLIPAHGPARWKALSLEALGDGIMDAMTAIRLDRAFHPQQESREWYERQMVKIGNGFDRFQAEAQNWSGTAPLTIGHVTAGVMCGCLDFSFAEVDWRTGRPDLAHWYEQHAKRPSMATTIPHR